ncbi:MAG: hypothetical protein JWR42_1636 [Marmoricola sp.]|nr:hypothetical protein [Marmoricola sp.]
MAAAPALQAVAAALLAFGAVLIISGVVMFIGAGPGLLILLAGVVLAGSGAVTRTVACG